VPATFTGTAGAIFVPKGWKTLARPTDEAEARSYVVVSRIDAPPMEHNADARVQVGSRRRRRRSLEDPLRCPETSSITRLS
jgi:hypothetical protein